MVEEKTYNQMRKEFSELFSHEISKQIKYFEHDRKARLRQDKLSITILICFTVLWVCLFPFLIMLKNAFFSTNIIYTAYIVYVGVICILCYKWIYFNHDRNKVKKELENKIKSKIMKTFSKCFGYLKWENGGYKGREKVFIESSLFTRFNSSEYDDIFYGTYKGVNYEIIEVQLYSSLTPSTQERDRIFKGVIVNLDMNKSFHGNTCIFQNCGYLEPYNNKLRKTTMEDIEFEQKFEVYTDDEVEARYLITPSFMEHLKNMKTLFYARGLRCSFYNNRLLFALKTSRDIFSLGKLDVAINDPSQFYRMFDEILSVIKLIDYFKLDQRIGM